MFIDKSNNGHPKIYFELCKTPEGNALLKENLSIAISTLFSYIPKSAIKDIQITGSIANGEGTVIFTNSEIIASDLDLVVMLNLPYYIYSIATKLDQKISGIATSYLRSKGIKTHVCFTLNSPFIKRIVGIFQKSRIYDYEDAYNKSLFEKERHVKLRHLPTREDALQLIFTTMAEYIMIVPALPLAEKLYWFIKRYLTLFYSMLIFEGTPILRYSERVKKALEILPKSFLSPRRAILLEAFLNFKLSGDLQTIFNIFGSRDLKEINNILEKELLRLILEMLHYQITQLYCFKYDGRENLTILEILNIYYINTEKSLAQSLLHTFIVGIFAKFIKRSNSSAFIRLPLMYRHSIINMANYIIGSVLLAMLGLNNGKIDAHFFIGLPGFSLRAELIKEFWNFADGLKYIFL